MSGSNTTMAAPAAPRAKLKPAGLIAIGVWISIAVAFVIYFAQAFDVTLIQRFGWSYLSGLWVTVSLVAVSFVCGAIVSLPVALGRMATNPIASGAASGVGRYCSSSCAMRSAVAGLGAGRPSEEAAPSRDG